VAAVLGGLGAAVIWAVGSAFASRAARALGSTQTLAWVMLVGMVLLGLVLPWTRSPHISGVTILWLALGGAGNVAGLLLMYHALRIGQMGVVMPIVTTEGGIAALISILAGEAVSTVVAIALAVTVAGVIMTAVARRPTAPARPAPEIADRPAAVATPQGHGDRRASVWASVGAVSFGISLFATGRASGLLPAAWAVLPPRAIGVIAVSIPLALRRRLRLARGTWHLLLSAGVCEVAGFLAYATGARHGIAVAAVLATLTGAIGASFGRVFFGERLQLTQVLGIVVTFAGLAMLTGFTA
jgi:drug/metabolite transporter (DMT)-like permease